MPSVNKAFLIGYLGKDPEVKTFANGNKVVNMSLATSKQWKDRDGEKKEKTSWHRIVVYHKQMGEFAEKYLKKGMLIQVEGEIDVREYEHAGEKRTAVEILLQGFNCALQSLEKIEGGGGSRPPAQTEADLGEMPY